MNGCVFGLAVALPLLMTWPPWALVAPEFWAKSTLRLLIDWPPATAAVALLRESEALLAGLSADARRDQHLTLARMQLYAALATTGRSDR